MTANLEVIKQLRSIGASIKLQDDVAKKVGGYDSPLFLPTVEFIVKIQQAFKGQGKKNDKEMQSAPLPNAFEPSAFYGVDLDSAKDVVTEGDSKKKTKKQSVGYINQRIGERDDFLDKNPDFDAEKNLIPRRKKDKKQQQQKSVKKSHIMSFLANITRAVMEQASQASQTSRQNAAQSPQQSSQRQQSSRRNILNMLRVRRNVMDHAHDHDHHHHEEHHEQPSGKETEKAGTKPTKDDFLKKLKKDPRIAELHENMEKNGHKVTDLDLLQAAKSAKKELGEVSKDLIISKMINDIKSNATHKDNGPNHKEPATKEQMISEAAAKLDMIGVKPIKAGEPQINNKKALAEHQPQTEQKQRT